MERTSDLKKELWSFPSYLKSFKDLGTCSKKKLKQILDRIISDLETYDYEVERIQDLNLTAFLYLEIGDKAHALEYIDKALSSNSRNVNALVLKGWFHLKSADIYECDQILKRLGPLRNDSTEMLHAKAELAYIYTRLGIKFYDKAIAMFESIFSEIDQNKLTIDPIAFVVWKFGLALTMKRTLNFNNLHEQNEFNFTMEKVKAILKVYSDIHESQIDRRYMARSLVEIGELLNKTTSQEHVKTLQAIPGLPKKPVEEYFKEALKICDSDAFVLQRCGRYYRYQNNVEKSIELLRKSIQGRYHEYNSYGHHHLALSLKKKLENSLQRTYRYSKRGGQYRPPNNYRRGRMQRGARGFNEHRELEMDSNTGLAYNADLGPDSRCHTPASGGYYGPRFSRERTRARSSRRSHGRCRNFRKFRGMDDSSQSRPSGSLPFEEMGKTTRLQELLVKSPQNLISLEDADKHKVAEILDHLDKAHQINGNIGALYDKGLTLRALGRYDDALTVFKLFFEEDSSLVYLANAYEQSAFCMISKLGKLKDEREREKITCNLQHWLSACIEISYRTIMQKYPTCKYCWASESVLEVILSKKDRTKESRKELCDFYRKVEDYARAIDFAEDLLTLGGDQEDQYATRMKMIDDYYNLQQYDNAILTINLIGNQMDDLSLFHKVHLEGGFQSYVKGELELAKTRLKTALNRSCRKIQDVSDGEEKEADHNDIFILCSENNEDCPRQVKQGLENLGLQVTVNFDNVGLYETKPDVDKVMKSSSHFVCFLEQGNTLEDDRHMAHWLEVIKNVHVERGSGHILFIKRDLMTDIPTNFAHFPSMEYDDDMADVAQSKKMEETQIQWLKILLQKLVNDLQN